MFGFLGADTWPGDRRLCVGGEMGRGGIGRDVMVLSAFGLPVAECMHLHGIKTNLAPRFDAHECLFVKTTLRRTSKDNQSPTPTHRQLYPKKMNNPD